MDFALDLGAVGCKNFWKAQLTYYVYIVQDIEFGAKRKDKVFNGML
jgi:hypothetical protein